MYRAILGRTTTHSELNSVKKSEWVHKTVLQYWSQTISSVLSVSTRRKSFKKEIKFLMSQWSITYTKSLGTRVAISTTIIWCDRPAKPSNSSYVRNIEIDLYSLNGETITPAVLSSVEMPPNHTLILFSQDIRSKLPVIGAIGFIKHLDESMRSEVTSNHRSSVIINEL